MPSHIEKISHPRDREWSGAEKCVLWLTLMLLVFGYYYWSTDRLIANPEAEPYFSRPTLLHVRRGLLVMIGVSIPLLVVALVQRKRDPENPWVPHIANQLWWIFGSLIVYAAGPVTTPALGLLIAFGLLGTLLFTPRVVLPAMFSGVLVLTATTVAERMEILPYAPMFNELPSVGGHPPNEFVVWTSLVALVVLVASLLIITWMAQRGRMREDALIATDRQRRRVQADLESTLASLRETEERFRQIAENVRDVFWLVELDSGRILYLSPPIEELCWISRDEVYADPSRFLTNVHVDDRERMAREFSTYSDHMTEGFSGGAVEYRLVHPQTGQVRWIYVRAFPIRDEVGHVIRIGGLIEDISERHESRAALQEAARQLEQRIEERTLQLLQANQRLESEAGERRRAEAALRESEGRLREQLSELEHLYRHTPVGLCLLDSELRYVRINDRLAAINGRSAEEHLGRTVAEVLPDLAAKIVPLIRHAMEAGAEPVEFEYTGPAAGDSETDRSWLATYAAMRSADGETLGVTTVVQEITALKRTEERARLHLEELARVSRIGTLGHMATGIAHELNQPLASIANYAYAARMILSKADGVATPQLGKIFDELMAQSLRAGEIVQRLRAFIGKRSARRDTVPVDRLVTEVLKLLVFELRSSAVVPELHLGSDLVRVDVVQIQQIVVNLVRNALDAMSNLDPAERRLVIESAGTANEIEIAVRDSGAGLGDAIPNDLFDAFFTTKSDGMGMGLTISRSIVEDHGGRMWAERNPDRGMTFRFTLPRSTAEESADVS